jgi:serine/threonine protein kinase
MMACKVIPRNQSDPDVNKDIEREVEILSKVNHRNTVGLKNVMNSSNNTYIFLEYCSEGDLREFIPRFNKRKESFQ